MIARNGPSRLLSLTANEVPFGGGLFLLVQQVDDGLVEAVSHVEAVAGARHVADDNVEAGCGGTQVDRGRGLELAETVLAGGALPLALGEAGVFFRLLDHGVVGGGGGAVGGGAGGGGGGELRPH